MTVKSISRSKVDLFRECPLCFYLATQKEVKRPGGLPFTLNNAVDQLLKKELDIYRNNQKAHPLVSKFGLNLVPYQSPLINDWRTMTKGIRTLYKNVEFYGIVDDIWQDDAGNLVVIDYKATAKKEPVVVLDAKGFHDQYRKQLEFYAWLLLRNGYPVSQSAYLLYCTGDTQAATFNQQLLFHTHLIKHECTLDWIEPVLDNLISVGLGVAAPPADNNCAYCKYYQARKKTIL